MATKTWDASAVPIRGQRKASECGNAVQSIEKKGSLRLSSCPGGGLPVIGHTQHQMTHPADHILSAANNAAPTPAPPPRASPLALSSAT